MESCPVVGGWRAGGVVPIDAFEKFDQIKHSNLHARFFQQFARDSLRQRFAEFQDSSGYGPSAFQGLASAADQQNFAVIDYDAAHPDDRTLRIFSRKGHLLNRTRNAGYARYSQPSRRS